MDAHINAIMAIKIGRTIENLRKNRMNAYYVDSREGACKLITELCAPGQTVGCGGSMTLAECGVLDLLRSGQYNFLDRLAPGADQEAVDRQAASCDTYFMSSNAITEQGELYNVDGNSNRISALAFGPKNVIIVAGYNKLVRDMEEAMHRVCDIAAPSNAVRLKRKVPCVQTGNCCDCRSEDRICSNYLISRWQRSAGRIKVIIVGEAMGY